MSPSRSVLVTLSLLLGVWLLLGLIALAAGVLPLGAPETAAPPERPSETPPADPARRADAGAPLAAAAHYVLCDGVAEDGARAERAFLVADLLAGGPGEAATPEIVVGCGNRFVVLAWDGDALVRVALVRLASPEGAAGGTPAAGDVDGDGVADLVLPFAGRAPHEEAESGRLALLGGIESEEASGSLAEPRNLAEGAWQQVMLLELDAAPGLDLLAVERGRPWDEELGRAEMFGGGRRVRSRGALEAGPWAREAALADLDLDGDLDVVVSSEGVLHVYPREARPFRFGAPHAIPSQSAWAMAVGDLDGDGHDDVLAGGTRLGVLRARAREGLEGLGLVELGAGVERQVLPEQILDVDGDGRADVLAIDFDRLLLLRQRDGERFEAELLYEGARVRGGRVADVDGDGSPELLVVLQQGQRVTVAVAPGSVLGSPFTLSSPERLRIAPFGVDYSLP